MLGGSHLERFGPIVQPRHQQSGGSAFDRLAAGHGPVLGITWARLRRPAARSGSPGARIWRIWVDCGWCEMAATTAGVAQSVLYSREGCSSLGEGET